MSQQATAQSMTWVNTYDPHAKSNLAASAVFNDSLILLGGKVSKTSCFHQAFWAVNKSGDSLWHKDYLNANINILVGAFYTTPTHFYTVGLLYASDDVLFPEDVMLVKYDAAGGVVSSARITSPVWTMPPWEEPVFLKYNSQGVGAIGVKKSLFMVLSDTVIGKQFRPGFSNDMVSMDFLNDSTLVAATTDRIYTFDTAGNQLDSFVNYDNIREVLVDSNKFYVLTEGELVRVNAAFQPLDTLSSATYGFHRVKKYDDVLYVLDSDSLNVNLHKLENTSTLTYSFQNKLKTLDFHITEGQVVFTGDSWSGQMGTIAYPLSTRPIEKQLPDVSLVDARLRNIEVDEFLVTTYNANGVFTVKNNGLDTLRSFSVYSFLGHLMNCYNSVYYEVFDSVRIAPGQTKTVVGKEKFLGKVQGDRVVDLCFEVLAPNHQLETQLDSNEFCGIYLIVGVEDANTNLVSVYPNPSSGQFNLKDLLPDAYHLQVFDGAGRIVLNESFDKYLSEDYQFNLHHKGCYYLRLEQANGEVRFAKLLVN